MPANPLTDPNWATETTDKLVSLIDTVRAQTTQKVVYAARGAVFGVIAVMLGALIAFILDRRAHACAAGAARACRRLGHRRSTSATSSSAALLSVVGMVLFRKRNAAAS